MEQQQIKVSFSVGTKLLISVVVLLFLVIFFLNIATIFLFREDKRAYTYQTQSTESLLAGREFLSLSRQSVNTLKSFLAAIDPIKPIDPIRESQLKNALANQSSILGVTFYLVHPDTGESRKTSQLINDKEVASSQIHFQDYEVKKDWFEYLLPTLKSNSIAFVNLSQPGAIPTVVVLFADTDLKNNPAGMPVIAGLVSLKSFAANLSSLQVTIATKEGWVLFDTDSAVMFGKENISKNPLFTTAVNSQLENGAMEYDFKDTHYLGSYLNPGMGLIVLTKTDWRKAMKPTYALIEKCIILGALSVGAAIIFAILFSKTLTAPLGRLYAATKEVAGGNFELLLEEKGSDEITALSKSFNIMSKKISELIQESIKKVQLENEFAIASTVQQTLIPPAEYRNDWLSIHSHYQPADQCGGDWWGFFGVGQKAVIMIADATGHGLPSALITASARSCFSVMQKWAQEDPDFSFSPSAMLSFANRVIFDASQGRIMMTFFIGVIDKQAGTITYSNAGHNPPWLFRKQPDGEFTLTSLMLPGPRLGEERENHSFPEKTAQISQSDILFLYTDGLLEGKNLAGEMYGKKNVRKLVEANLKAGPYAIVTNVIETFMKYNEGKSLDDDVTIATLVMEPSLGVGASG